MTRHARRFRYHLSFGGALYIGATAILAVGAVNSQNNLLFIALGLALGALIMSGLMSGPMLMGLRAEREPTPPGAVGDRIVIRYAVTNRSRFLPAFALSITELPTPAFLPRLRAMLRRSAPLRHDWRPLMPRPLAFIAHVPPGKTVFAEAAVCPSRRGVAALSGFAIVSTFPFGILRKSVAFTAPQEALIRPEPAPVDVAVLSRAAAMVESGAVSSRHIGRGLEPLGLREYSPGDSYRDVAWRASARLGELVVRETGVEVASRLWVALSLARIPQGASPALRAELESINERAISVAAGVIEKAAFGRCDVGLIAPAARIVRAPMGGVSERRSTAGRRRAASLMDDLARIDLTELSDDRNIPARLGRDAVIVVHAGPVNAAGWSSIAHHIAVSPPSDHLPRPSLSSIEGAAV